MPGPKRKKGGKKKGGSHHTTTRALWEKEPGQEYGRVTALLGNARLRVLCSDGVERLGIIRGKMRRRVWIRAGDVILIALREFSDERCDVIHKYRDEEVRALKKSGDLVDLGDDVAEAEEDDGFVFGEEKDEDDNAPPPQPAIDVDII